MSEKLKFVFAPKLEKMSIFSFYINSARLTANYEKPNMFFSNLFISLGFDFDFFKIG